MIHKTYNPKFKVGDLVMADNDVATITQILYPADSDMFDSSVSYAVRWSTNEWGTFDEDELNNEQPN